MVVGIERCLSFVFLGLAADCDLTRILNLIYRIQRVQIRVFGFLVCGLTLMLLMHADTVLMIRCYIVC